MNFPSRRRILAIDLSALLARTSAVQSASPTARAQVRLDAACTQAAPVDPHVFLFADGDAAPATADHGASFAALSRDIFSPRQPN